MTTSDTAYETPTVRLVLPGLVCGFLDSTPWAGGETRGDHVLIMLKVQYEQAEILHTGDTHRARLTLTGSPSYLREALTVLEASVSAMERNAYNSLDQDELSAARTALARITDAGLMIDD